MTKMVKILSQNWDSNQDSKKALSTTYSVDLQELSAKMEDTYLSGNIIFKIFYSYFYGKRPNKATNFDTVVK